MIYTLTLLDTTGIQDYIFSSNRLQENIGASEIVYRATTLWAFQALKTAGISQHNISQPANLNWDFNDREIERDAALQAEVIQAAGGNMLILFRQKQDSRRFIRELTLSLLKDAPGLTLLAQHKDDFDFDAHQLSEARHQLEKKMQQHKNSRRPSLPTLGLGITATCDSTGLPAVVTLAGEMEVAGKVEPLGLDGEDDSTRISSEVAAKRAWRSQANERLKFALEGAADDFEFPYDLENIGREKGEESYIAVIHADGNRMGQHVTKATSDAPNNREWIRSLRKFSKNVQEISRAALLTVVGQVVQAVKNKAIPYVVVKGKKYLPFRPLVFGGDDVTFVANGRIGLSLAAAYLETFQQEAQNCGLNLYASAGVSIVKLHYPFARAYALSEELADSAKGLTRATDCSALDWHFAQSGLSGSLKSIRKREYLTPTGKPLHLRPLTLETGANSWQAVENALAAFNDDYWSKRHNKVIGLREPLRLESVARYRLDFDLKELPAIPGAAAEATGWDNGICYYFDAIEILDHYVPLKTRSTQEAAV